MRSLMLAFASVALLGAAQFYGSAEDEAPAVVQVRLQDAATGRATSGIVRITRKGGAEAVSLPGLLPRLRGVNPLPEAAGWFVIPAAGGETKLPPGEYQVAALCGLESELAVKSLRVEAGKDATVSVSLPSLFQPEKEKLFAGNTHLHLMKLTRKEADDYLKAIPPADRLRVLFVSYLERNPDDETYITNRYTRAELKAFDATGVLFDNGEEHRHNFEAYGQGYGHVMFLQLKDLVRPVSLGPGITKEGNDDRPLSDGIREARGQNATVIWCHNTNGHEDVLNALAGRFQALNVFDGSRTGTYEENYYRYLNIGLRMPISTGTDWFIYDFSRVYAEVDGPLSVDRWLAGLREGRCQATNGPLLRLEVDGKKSGSVLDVAAGRKLPIVAAAIGRHDFGTLELVQNGKVVATAKAERKGNGYEARLTHTAALETSAWFAARIDTKNRNEFQQQLFAHTSPVYADVGGKRVFHVASAEALLRHVEEAIEAIRARGKFTSDAARDKLLSHYRAAIEDLRGRINRRGQ
jgi:hypothetical protein